MTQEPIKTESVKDFMTSKNFTQVAKTIRENSNNYPYITFIDKDNKAENVYFSKNLSKKYIAGEIIEKGFFDNIQIGYTKNAEGEIRTKLVSKESNRLDINDLF